MPTHLDAINRARAKFEGSKLNATEVQSQVSANGREAMEAASSAIDKIVAGNTVADFNSETGYLTLTIGQAQVTRPTDGSLDFDVNKINDLAIKDVSTGKLKPLTWLSDKQALYRENYYADAGKPKYAYIRNRKLFVMPAPDIAYELAIITQKVNKAVTSENVLEEVDLEGDIYEAYIKGIYAYIRQSRSDPRAGSFKPRDGLLGEFANSLDQAERNDLQTLKRRGLKQLKFVTRSSSLHRRRKRTGGGNFF